MPTSPVNRLQEGLCSRPEVMAVFDFLLGVNYWPRATAMEMWERFDAAAIADDFAQIAALELQVVRFFLRWDAFQPGPETIDSQAVEHFATVLDLADAAGLRTIPTLFCGHMSGANWLPSWTLDPELGAGRFRTITENGESPYGIGDFYADERLLQAQVTFARAVGRRARGREAVLAWDLGNEFSNLRAAETANEGATWSARLTHELARASDRPVTGGIHGEDVAFERGLRPSSLCAPWDLATMHGYPAYSEFARSVDDPEVVPFLCELIAGLARKPVLFSEFGNPACPSQGSAMPCLDEPAMATYAYAVLDRLHDRGALGALWWCWTDYAGELAATPPFDRAPHELRFGIVRADGSPKPVAAALQAFARERRGIRPASLRPLVNEKRYYEHLPTSLAQAYRTYVTGHEAS